MSKHDSVSLRRRGVLVALPAAVALTLTACGGGDGGDSGSDAAGGFTFAFPTASTNQTAWEALAADYQEESGVKIELKGLPNDSYGVSIRTQLQGGNAADLMVVAPGRGQDYAVLPLAEAGYLEPLTEDASAAVVPKGSEGLFYLDDKLYAQPTDLVPVGMAWNSGAATESGVDVPSDTEALLKACGALADEGKSMFAVAGAAPPNVGLVAMSVSATRVYAETPDWNHQRADGDVTFADSDGWKDTLQTIVDMNNGGCFQKGAAGAGFDAITQGITQGTSLAAFAPGASASELMKSTPGLTIENQPFPATAGGDPYVLASTNYAVAVSAKSEAAQKEAAQGFVAWLAKPENAQKVIDISGGVPVTGIDKASLQPQYQPMADLLANGDYAPVPNLEWPNPSVYDALSTGIQGLLAGQGDIQSVLQAVDKAWDQ
jgi:raffinose/stachyose/melibiose transport system substrate-binding protein